MKTTGARDRPEKGDATREAIVDRALAQAVAIGLEGVSLAVLAESLHLSKSGVFAHFKSKEALQLAVLEEAIERFMQRVVLPALAAPRGAPRVRALFERKVAWIENSGFGTGCFFMSLTQEYDDRPGAVRDRLIQSQRDWRDAIAKAVTLAIAERHFAASVDPMQIAFEIEGITTAYHHALKLFGEADAKERALRAFARLEASCERKKRA